MANWSTDELCPILQDMREHVVNASKGANMIVVIIHGLVSSFGILENTLVLWLVGFRLHRKTVASVWVLNLALSDFLATLTLPFFTLYLYQSHSWEIGVVLCKMQTSIFFVNMFVSAFLLAAISLDRLLLVVKPLWSKRHRTVGIARKVCAIGWLWAAINAVPYTVFRTVIERKDGGKMCYHNFALLSSSQATLMRDCEVRQEATAISKFLLAFLCPLAVIVGSYIQIGLSLKDRSRRRNNNQAHQRQFSPGFIRMVALVITAFILCWAPYHILCIIESIAHYQRDALNPVQLGLPIATTIAFLNPVLNPILYVFSCPQFCMRLRQSLGSVLDGLVQEDDGTPRPFGNVRRGYGLQQSFQGTKAVPPACSEASQRAHN